MGLLDMIRQQKQAFDQEMDPLDWSVESERYEFGMENVIPVALRVSSHYDEPDEGEDDED